MTTGEKLYKLRRENGFTQEQIADILGVSRQAISKWESDIAYPETDKLIKLGELYDCSMDYLLKNDEENKAQSSNVQDSGEIEKKITLSFDFKSWHFERKSKRYIGKLPLWHINIGFGRTATGVFAVGLTARGIVSIGLLALGLVSFGLVGVGLLAFGAFALGFISAGSIAVGVAAFGAIAVGIMSAGAVSVGHYAVGALAIGKYFAWGDHARAMIAIGKTVAEGSVFSAHGVTGDNRSEIIRLLNEYTPTMLGWAKHIVFWAL